MSYQLILIIFTLCFLSCKVQKVSNNADYIIAFGSCDNQRLPNLLWKEVDKHQPAVWIWGGDNVYCDTEDMAFLKDCYQAKLSDTSYANFTKDKLVIGTWDDHDYGKNDGGVEYVQKRESQRLFFDFMKDAKQYSHPEREGVYYAVDIPKQNIKIIILDTRYFRTALRVDPTKSKRFVPSASGTILGEIQWQWLEKELNNSKAELTIIMSSIQLLSSEHGFETWGNMPHEQEKMEKLLVQSKAKNVLFLSGDRHISEFSKKEVTNLDYPIYDFTSSGLTHAYRSFSGEVNKYRVGEVIHDVSFGLLRWNKRSKRLEMEIRGKENRLLNSLSVQY
jgi:alkaline phosphatase D